MTRTVLVFLMAALLCVALTGLRVAMLERLALPPPQISPRTIKEPQPPGEQRPIEYITGAPARRAAASLAWSGALRGRDARGPRPR